MYCEIVIYMTRQKSVSFPPADVQSVITERLLYSRGILNIFYYIFSFILLEKETLKTKLSYNRCGRVSTLVVIKIAFDEQFIIFVYSVPQPIHGEAKTA
jgi:hypothetical protein